MTNYISVTLMQVKVVYFCVLFDSIGPILANPIAVT